MSDLVSILIPAYNVERYVARCLDSVIGQTYRHLEIIVVNDGSTDGTSDILEEYAARDHRIKVIDHPANCGLLWARKTGIEASSGKYLMFVDSDDEMTPDACGTLYPEAVRTGADLVIGGHDQVEVSGTVHKMVNELRYGGSSYGMAKAMALDELDRFMWGKIFKRELFTGHPLSFFKNHNIGEDQILSWQIARYVKKVVCIPDIVYRYHRNSSSLIYNFGSNKDLRDVMLTEQITISMAGEIDAGIKERTETNAMRNFFNWIKNGLGRRRVMALVDESGFRGLYTFPSLVSHLGLRKALTYSAVTRFDFVPWLLYGRRWKK